MGIYEFLREPYISDMLSGLGLGGPRFENKELAVDALKKVMLERKRMKEAAEARKAAGQTLDIEPTPRDYAKDLFRQYTEESMALGPGQGFPESPRPPMDRPEYPISEEFSDLEKGIAFGAMDPEKVARIREQAKAKFGPQYAQGIFAQADVDSLSPMQRPEAVLESQKDLARDATIQRITGRIEDIQSRRAMSPAAHRPGDLAELEQLRGLRQELEADKFLGWQQAMAAAELQKDYAKIAESERYHQGLLGSSANRQAFEMEKYYQDRMDSLRNQPIEMWGRLAEQYAKDGDDIATSLIMTGISQAQATGDDPSQRIMDLFSRAGRLEDLLEKGVMLGGESGMDAFDAHMFGPIGR